MIWKFNKKQTINLLKQGDTKTLNAFYLKHKWEFIKYFRKKFQGYEKKKYTEIFHESILIMLEQLRAGRSIEYSLKTYVYSIAMNLFREYVREYNNRITFTEKSL